MAGKEPNGKAIASLVLGILGIAQVLPCLGPILAIAMGWDETEGPGRAGVILGVITLALYAVAAFVFIVFVLVGGTLVSVSG